MCTLDNYIFCEADNEYCLLNEEAIRLDVTVLIVVFMSPDIFFLPKEI